MRAKGMIAGMTLAAVAAGCGGPGTGYEQCEAREFRSTNSSYEVLDDATVEIPIDESEYNLHARRVDVSVVLDLFLADQPVFTDPDLPRPNHFIFPSTEEAQAADPDLQPIAFDLPIPDESDESSLGVSLDRAATMYYLGIDTELGMYMSVGDEDGDSNPEVIVTKHDALLTNPTDC